MLNPINNLSELVARMGKAYVYVGNPFVASSMTPLGVTEGEIGVDEQFQYNEFKLPEWTGDAVHEADVDGQSLNVTVPVIMGAADHYNKVHPLGVKGGGRSAPMAVVETSALIVPIKEVGSGLSYDGTTWTPAAPEHAIWIWRATLKPGRYAFKHADGGKVIREVTITAMFDDARPEGQKLYTIGDPVTQGIGTVRL